MTGRLEGGVTYTQTKTTLYLGQYYEVEVGTAITSTKYYFHGDTRVAMRDSGEVYYLYGDHLGSTSLATNENGDVVYKAGYLPYGGERLSNGISPTDFGFTDQRNEVGLGLMDYNARYYDPFLGRFISPDPIVPDPTNSGGFDRYRYTRNNPVKYTDPSGHCAVCLIVIGVVVALDVVDVGTSLYVTANPDQFSPADISYAETSLGFWQAGVMADGPAPFGDVVAASVGAFRGGKTAWRWGARALAGQADQVQVAGAASKSWRVINEVVDPSIVKQAGNLSCGAACGEMLTGVPQDVIEKMTGAPTSAERLAWALNQLDSAGKANWAGGGFDFVEGQGLPVVNKLNKTGSWIAMMKNPGNPNHFVVVDGFDDVGNLMIRDPWEGTKYSMETNEFLNNWLGYGVYNK